MCLYLGWGYKQLQSFQDLSTKSRQKKFWNTFSLLKCETAVIIILPWIHSVIYQKNCIVKKNNLEKL